MQVSASSRRRCGITSWRAKALAAPGEALPSSSSLLPGAVAVCSLMKPEPVNPQAPRQRGGHPSAGAGGRLTSVRILFVIRPPTVLCLPRNQGLAIVQFIHPGDHRLLIFGQENPRTVGGNELKLFPFRVCCGN